MIKVLVCFFFLFFYENKQSHQVLSLSAENLTALIFLSVCLSVRQRGDEVEESPEVSHELARCKARLMLKKKKKHNKQNKTKDVAEKEDI